MLLAILVVSSVSVINWWWFISTRKFLKQGLMADEIGNEKNTSWLNLKLSLAPSPLLCCLCNCNIDIYIFIYKVFREMCMPWLVRTSSLYFHKASTLHHRSALLRYNACSLCHWYEHAQFTIHFIKEKEKLVPRALLSYISTWEFLRTHKKCKKHLPSACASLFLKIPAHLYNSTMH